MHSMDDCRLALAALHSGMPELTRRRSPDAPDECWHVYYRDVRVGTIAIRTGMPPGEDPWGWSCGFYPGAHPGECTDGTAATFDQARADFEQAWAVFLSNRTEADFQAWRNQRDWTGRKYAMWERGERMPAQRPGSLMRCPSGEIFNSHLLEHTLIHVPHVTAAQAAPMGFDAEMKCALCEDCGWVCESHPDRPWEGGHACTCGAAGAPCPQCNPIDDDMVPRMPKGSKTELDKKGWRH
jgi:hypothetical protein